MNRILATGMCVVTLFSASVGFSQTQGATGASRMSDAEFQQTIAELRSPMYRVRVAATERLAKRGKLAKADLTQLAKHKDAEVRSRATQLLARFDPVRKTEPNVYDTVGGEVVFLDGSGTVVLGGAGFGFGAAEFEFIEIIEGLGRADVPVRFLMELEGTDDD